MTLVARRARRRRHACWSAPRRGAAVRPRRGGRRGGPRCRRARGTRCGRGSPSAPTGSGRSWRAGSGAAGTGIPAASRSWPTSTAWPAWATRPRCTSARTGYVGLNPIGGGRTNVALVVPAERGAEARGRVEAFFLERAARVSRRCTSGSTAGALVAAGARDRAVRGVVGPGDRRRRAPWWATPPTSSIPFTGEGIYSALRGAELLADDGGGGAGPAGARHRRPARAATGARGAGRSPASGRSSG